MIKMKLTARLMLLLVLAGILVLSVPSMAGERPGANSQVAAQLQSSTEVTAPSFMENVMATVRAQIKLWMNMAAVPVVKPEIKPSQPDKPVKSSTPYQPKPWLDDVLLDNGGPGVEK